ncbi:MAG: agmatinase [Gammaproteobacteria bacterium]|nr:agmatinase [Gammaproteobacteria bacterium]
MNKERIFAGIFHENINYESSEIVLIPVPYDGTSTYGKGADKGPEAILDAAENMEVYDIETDSEVYKKGVYITKAIEEFSTPDSMVQAVETAVSKHLDLGKFVSILGGEHSVSIGAIRAFKNKFENLSVLQLDAHSDLRPIYNGSKYNHACALHEASQNTNLVQVGIRSMDSIEKEFLTQENFFTSYEIRSNKYWQEDIMNCLGQNVYITIDLDVFDPSIMPSTGTPEPGGLMWDETLSLLKKVFVNFNVVGFDIVELAPIKDLTAPDFMAAKLYYKLLSYKFYL